MEKALKALLIAHGIRPPKTHDIDVLILRLEEVGEKDLWSEDLSALTAYSVEARYPGPRVTQEEAEHALIVAKRTFFEVLERLRRLGLECPMGRADKEKDPGEVGEDR